MSNPCEWYACLHLDAGLDPARGFTTWDHFTHCGLRQGLRWTHIEDSGEEASYPRLLLNTRPCSRVHTPIPNHNVPFRIGACLYCPQWHPFHRTPLLRPLPLPPPQSPPRPFDLFPVTPTLLQHLCTPNCHLPGQLVTHLRQTSFIV